MSLFLAVEDEKHDKWLRNSLAEFTGELWLDGHLNHHTELPPPKTPPEEQMAPEAKRDSSFYFHVDDVTARHVATTGDGLVRLAANVGTQVGRALQALSVLSPRNMIEPFGIMSEAISQHLPRGTGTDDD